MKTPAYSKPAIDASFDDYQYDDNKDDDDAIMSLLKSLIFHLLHMEKKNAPKNTYKYLLGFFPLNLWMYMYVCLWINGCMFVNVSLAESIKKETYGGKISCMRKITRLRGIWNDKNVFLNRNFCSVFSINLAELVTGLLHLFLSFFVEILVLVNISATLFPFPVNCK